MNTNDLAEMIPLYKMEESELIKMKEDIENENKDFVHKYRYYRKPDRCDMLKKHRERAMITSKQLYLINRVLNVKNSIANLPKEKIEKYVDKSEGNFDALKYFYQKLTRYYEMKENLDIYKLYLSNNI